MRQKAGGFQDFQGDEYRVVTVLAAAGDQSDMLDDVEDPIDLDRSSANILGATPLANSGLVTSLLLTGLLACELSDVEMKLNPGDRIAVSLPSPCEDRTLDFRVVQENVLISGALVGGFSNDVFRSNATGAKIGLHRCEHETIAPCGYEIDLVAVGLDLAVSPLACLSPNGELDGLGDDEAFMF
ncbi:hypothetical protein GCM10010468_76370 [Actinocorallia longicatena]|uniref:Uncharacterized protein n=1 Tax=Actinocorallia longicatena TaxID=111803 RepID=A0ABP6QLF6_9ACTN